MIMVEGKLQSWGRAETVLKILDIDVAGKKLEATLEDIVEAVYNCGDRQSSLVYLQQECQCCFTYFPMSKVSVSNNATFMHSLDGIFYLKLVIWSALYVFVHLFCYRNHHVC